MRVASVASAFPAQYYEQEVILGVSCRITGPSSRGGQ